MSLRTWVEWLWSDSIPEYRWVSVTIGLLAAGMVLVVAGAPGSAARTVAAGLFVVAVLLPVVAILLLGVHAATVLYRGE